MISFVYEEIIEPILSLLGYLGAFFFANILSIFIFLLALLIIGRMVNERRRPGNIFGWAILIIIFPIIGVPLYFFFGGRKSRRLVKHKRESYHLSAQIIARVSAETADDIILHTQFKGNQVTLLGDGVETFKSLTEEIEKAEHSIHIMTYILGNDATGRHVVELLTRRASEGLVVRLLLDSLGSWGKKGRFVRPLRKAGGQVVSFMPMLPLQTHTSANLRNHRKIAIFDHKHAIVGGQNLDTRFISEEKSDDLFIDFSVHLKGPVVRGLNRIFLTDWAFAAELTADELTEIYSHQPYPCGESTIDLIPSGPEIESDPLWENIITLVQECREKITIVTPYFIPDEVLFQSLIIKAHAKRKVRLILPERSNHPLTDFARNHYIRRLNEEGVEILFHQRGMIHGKIIIADDRWALIGSANIDPRSLFVNFEIGLLHSSPNDIATFQNWVNQLLPDCIAYEDSQKVEQGTVRRLTEDFAHLLGPLL